METEDVVVEEEEAAEEDLTTSSTKHHPETSIEIIIQPNTEVEDQEMREIVSVDHHLEATMTST